MNRINIINLLTNQNINTNPSIFLDIYVFIMLIVLEYKISLMNLFKNKYYNE